LNTAARLENDLRVNVLSLLGQHSFRLDAFAGVHSEH